MPAKLDTITTIDLETASAKAEILIPEGTEIFRVQPTILSGSWGAAEVTCQQSLVGGTTAARWSSLDEPLVLTSSDEDLVTSARYIKAIRFLRFIVTTDQSGTPGELEIAVSHEGSTLARLQWSVTNSVAPS